MLDHICLRSVVTTEEVTHVDVFNGLGFLCLGYTKKLDTIIKACLQREDNVRQIRYLRASATFAGAAAAAGPAAACPPDEWEPALESRAPMSLPLRALAKSPGQ